MPRLVDVGAGKCIPCKAMAPILAQLRTDFAGRMEVEFVDVWVNPDAGHPYGIRMIPTQIFYGADGREWSRHEGFMSREEILARWKSHGIAF
ncbi:thioredoxin family protein [Anaeromyxobacter oryzisoli]|uniref:thioredoxin family protein n=1 Tax=Anaeromyxobacter oryzisoli TaxID=2925408 RepID=UPI001F579E75|nr:thioredoxin family protein [Anaeromyxobacter sp. SG63]